MNLLVNQTFDFSVSLRVAWSTIWRAVLISAVLGLVIKFVMPPSALELQIQAMISQKPAPSLEEIRAYVLTLDYSGSAYAYHLFKTYLPILFGTFIAVSFVFKKRYRRFSLRVTDLQGKTISTRWMPALCIATVFSLPSIFMALVGYLVYRLYPTLTLATGYVMATFLVGAAVLLYEAHLAVHWKYRHFRVQVEPTV